MEAEGEVVIVGRRGKGGGGVRSGGAGREERTSNRGGHGDGMETLASKKTQFL